MKSQSGDRMLQGRLSCEQAEKQVAFQGHVETAAACPANGQRQMDFSQLTQRKRVTEKYSCDEEFSFWDSFAETGLLSFEQRAVAAWVQPGTRVLDIGCGCGREAVALARQGYKVSAIDVVPRMVEAAEKRLRQQNLSADVACADVTESIPFSDTFQAAILFEQVYQHIPQRLRRRQALLNICERLAPDGTIMLTVFNEGDIDLCARWQWLRQSRWQMAKAVVLNDLNLLNARYLEPDSGSNSIHRASSWSERFRLTRWTTAYVLHMVHRKVMTKVRRHLCRDDDSSRCKAIVRTNPCTVSPGGFWLPVVSFPEVSVELAEVGLKICDTYVLSDDGDNLSPRAKRGSPLCLIVAKRQP